MSVRVMAAVWQALLNSTSKLVLLKLADCADDEGGRVYPSLARVAASCGLSDRAVRNALRELQSADVLHQVAPEDPGRHRPREYRIDLAQLAALPRAEAGGVTFRAAPDAGRHDVPDQAEPSAGRGGNDVPGRGERRAANPSLNRQKDPSGDPSEGRARRAKPTKPLSDEFPADEDRSYAAEAFGAWAAQSGANSPDVDTELAKFADHHRAKGSLFADWHAAWRTWVRNALAFREKDNSRDRRTGVAPAPTTIDDGGNVIRPTFSAEGGAHERTRTPRRPSPHDALIAGFAAAAGMVES